VTIAVVPVKDLASAKQRLAARLGPNERRTLVLLMLEDVLQALRRSPGVSATIVVTRDREVADRAVRFEAEVLAEPSNDGYTSAVSRAASELARRGESAMLSVPGDVPGVSPDEISCLIAACRAAPSVVFSPSRDGRGTNAALVSPPNAFDLQFGEPSFAAHVARARAAGLATEVLELERLALDLDSPEDLDAFLREPSTTATFYFLQEVLGGRPRPITSTSRSQTTR
jgi:2-phospho-L-lactate guanylyltransferase